MKIHLVLLSLACAGCANPYVAPLGEKLATIHLRNATANELTTATFDDGDRCSGIRSIPAGASTATNDPNSSWMAAGTSVTVKALPERSFTVTLRGNRSAPAPGGVYQTCDLTITFTPAPDGEYAVTFRWPTQQCTASVSAIQSTPSGAIETPVRTARARTVVAGLGNGGASCLP
jgi:hypothetical protein